MKKQEKMSLGAHRPLPAGRIAHMEEAIRGLEADEIDPAELEDVHSDRLRAAAETPTADQELRAAAEQRFLAEAIPQQVWTATPDGLLDSVNQQAVDYFGVTRRELLAEDPLFGEQPPAAVAIWDRILAHGTALGVAHGVVRSLPLGALADTARLDWSVFWGSMTAALGAALLVAIVPGAALGRGVPRAHRHGQPVRDL